MNDTERLTHTVSQFCEFIAALPEAAPVEQDWSIVCTPLSYLERAYRLGKEFAQS